MSSIIMNFHSDVNVSEVCIKLKNLFPDVEIVASDVSLAEQLEDEYLLALVHERKRNGSGITISWEEHLAKNGITQEELDAMEDVEIE
jgi:hypothetical protein